MSKNLRIAIADDDADHRDMSHHDEDFIERAKGRLMTQANLDEAAAFKRLQKLARDQRK